MGMFEYVVVLTSIILGLGITHLLQGMTRLIQDPEGGRPYWVHLTRVVPMRTRNERFDGAFAVANVIHQMSWAVRLSDTVGVGLR